MRKTLLAATVAALSSAAMLAVAADVDAVAPETRAYATFSFGGTQKPEQSAFHYGLRVDYQDRLATVARPAVMDLRFDRAGLLDTRINGLPVVQRLSLNQDEYGSNLPTTSYSIVDWGLVALGAVGIGFIAAETLGTEESPDPAPAPPPSSGGLLVGTIVDQLSVDGGRDFGFLPTYSERETIERERWLNSGSGQMGDLGG
jgi:hypothetical protein